MTFESRLARNDTAVGILVTDRFPEWMRRHLILFSYDKAKTVP
jgi:hypothetical protein